MNSQSVFVQVRQSPNRRLNLPTPILSQCRQDRAAYDEVHDHEPKSRNRQGQYHHASIHGAHRTGGAT